MSLIDTIEVKNFKSIRHVVMNGCKRINVFVGYPNVGKSNLLESLALFNLSDTNHFKDFIRVKSDPTLFFNGFLSNNIEVNVNSSYNAKCVYENSRLTLNISTPEFFSDGLRTTATRSLEFVDFLVRASRNNGFIPDEPFKIKKYEFKKVPFKDDKQFSELNTPFGENVFGLIQSDEKLFDKVSLLFEPYDLELLYDSAIQSFVILKRTNKGILSVPYELIADTLQRLIFYKAAIYSNNNTVLLFEEPEAHMFPPYMRQFTTDVTFSESNQFFIATHSPYILDAFLEEAPDDLAIFLVDYFKGETIVKRLTSENVDQLKSYGIDLFFNLEKYLKDGKVHND